MKLRITFPISLISCISNDFTFLRVRYTQRYSQNMQNYYNYKMRIEHFEIIFKYFRNKRFSKQKSRLCKNHGYFLKNGGHR